MGSLGERLRLPRRSASIERVTDLPPPAHADDDAFTSIAPFYDLDFETYYDDAEFYARLAANHGEEILELGCGTGRVTVPLARRGLKVTGVDVNEAMLAIARERSKGLEVTYRRGDMTDLDLRRTFRLVTIPLGSVQHLATSDDLVSTLEVVARHLGQGAVGVVDVESPHSDDFQVGPLPIVEHWTKPWQGGTVTKTVAVEPHPSEGSKWITWHFDVADAEGRLRRVNAAFAFRTITLDELHLAGRLAGLRIVARFGDYEFTPYHDGAERLIVLFQRADDPVQWIYEDNEEYDADSDPESDSESDAAAGAGA